MNSKIEQTEEPIIAFYAKARTKMAELYPQFAASILAGDYSRLEESFLADALDNKKLPRNIHRCTPERQEQLLAGHEETLFDGLSDQMIDFYRRKLNTST